MPPCTKDVLRLGKRMRVGDGGGGHRAEPDARLAEADGEVHLVAADEEAHVRQAHLEKHVGPDQGTVEEVSVVGQEAYFFQFGPIVGDSSVQPEEEGQPVGMARGNHQGDHGFKVAGLSLTQQRSEAFGICRLGVVVHHPDPFGAAGHGLQRGEGKAAGPAEVRFGTDVINIWVPRGNIACGVRAAVDKADGVHGRGLRINGVQQDGQLFMTVKCHGGNCNPDGHGDSFQHGLQGIPRSQCASVARSHGAVGASILTRVHCNTAL